MTLSPVCRTLSLAALSTRLRTVVAAALLVATPAVASPQQVDARDVVERVDRLLRGASSRASVSMQITTRQWSRSLDMTIWSKGNDYALVRVTAPAREAGTATLKVKNDIWNYLPRVDRTIRIPPSLMAGAWMGNSAAIHILPTIKSATPFKSVMSCSTMRLCNIIHWVV